MTYVLLILVMNANGQVTSVAPIPGYTTLEACFRASNDSTAWRGARGVTATCIQGPDAGNRR
jgi:hypothetical protein